jgi:hypothetical protein
MTTGVIGFECDNSEDEEASEGGSVVPLTVTRRFFGEGGMTVGEVI